MSWHEPEFTPPSSYREVAATSQQLIGAVRRSGSAARNAPKSLTRHSLGVFRKQPRSRVIHEKRPLRPSAAPIASGIGPICAIEPTSSRPRAARRSRGSRNSAGSGGREPQEDKFADATTRAPEFRVAVA